MPDLRFSPGVRVAEGPRTVEAGRFRRIALFGGIYSNYLALEQALSLARARGVDEIFALGDFGAFGPFPDRTLEILRAHGLPALQGNYEESLAGGADDCHCGYTDPRDNHYAQISYDYTRAHTAREHTTWMGTLPGHIRLTLGDTRVLLVHGSPRKINEFLWSSTTPAPFIERLLREHDTDLVACTHTGIHWSRFLDGARGVVNVGALGRPANDGRSCVWFTILQSDGARVEAEFVPVDYDQTRLGREMSSEGLPQAFVETLHSGYWTTCLEALPAKERARGRF